jgi:PAS domain-containing protein
MHIAPHPLSAHESDHGASDDEIGDSGDGRMQQKRAANRKSAQLSRKRKKQFIEELKEENKGLRRKEQILMSIPDLIVVFDSAGKLGFVSQSVSSILRISARDLEGSSFWDCLCDNSVRLLKAAFMDALAARQCDSDQAPLGSGTWELRFVNKEGEYIPVSLNGMVHFAGDRPECVCSIRLREDMSNQSIAEDEIRERRNNLKSSQASVISFGSMSKSERSCQNASTSAAHRISENVAFNERNSKRREDNRISDPSGASSCGESEGGSSDELMSGDA